MKNIALNIIIKTINNIKFLILISITYIIIYIRNIESDEKLKLKYLDCFLSRYFYYSFSRYFMRLGKFLGIVEDIW